MAYQLSAVLRKTKQRGRVGESRGGVGTERRDRQGGPSPIRRAARRAQSQWLTSNPGSKTGERKKKREKRGERAGGGGVKEGYLQGACVHLRSKAATGLATKRGDAGHTVESWWDFRHRKENQRASRREGSPQREGNREPIF